MISILLKSLQALLGVLITNKLLTINYVKLEPLSAQINQSNLLSNTVYYAEELFLILSQHFFNNMVCIMDTASSGLNEPFRIVNEMKFLPGTPT